MAATIHLGHIRSPEKLSEPKNRKQTVEKQADSQEVKTSEDMAVEKLKFYISRNIEVHNSFFMHKPSSAEEWANEKIKKYQK